jgi:CheY-like chemotaxis protein
MDDPLDRLLTPRTMADGRPLGGITVLAVEDSRYASEALRLMCLRSGARLRRADSMRSAHRHLSTYRPLVVIIDLGLPDGSGLDLIAALAGEEARIPAILGTSGDPALTGPALAAGADAFLAKPLDSLRAFQTLIADSLRARGLPPLQVSPVDEAVNPDPLALRDDLAQAVEALEHTADAPGVDYLAGFLTGVARSSGDKPLEAAARDWASGWRDAARTGPPARAPAERLSGLMRDRLRAGSSF